MAPSGKYLEECKAKLEITAKDLISDRIDFIEGVRIMGDLLDRLDMYKEDDNLFLSIVSDTDYVPVGEVRNLWNKQSLEELDLKLSTYIESARPDVVDACKRILKQLES